MDWIYLAQDRDQGRALVITVNIATEPSSCQRGRYIRFITASVHLGKYTDRGSQGTWAQEELIGGKP
jgi:hypothetical protein